MRQPVSSVSKPAGKFKQAYKAPALEKGLSILECLSQASAPMTLQHLSQELGRSASEIYRMLEVLVDQGYILREGGLHRLSLKMFNLGVSQMPARDLLTVSLPAMQEMALQSRQALHLCVHADKQLVVVAAVASPEPLGFSVRLGSQFPFRADRTSVRVIAAFQPAAIRELLVTEMIEQSLTQRVSRKSMNTRLDALRAQGFEEAPSDTVQGIVDVAFPIFDGLHPGAIASLNMPYLTQRDAHMSRHQARQLLSQTARRISQELGAVD
jgi:DNA-binding IclR family transcriptional regulator